MITQEDIDAFELPEWAEAKAMDEGAYMWLEANHSHCEELTSTGDSQVVCVDAING